MPGIAGIVLAAGEGRRAGGSKAFLKIGGQTFLERIVAGIREAGCQPVIVVGGAAGALIEDEAGRLGASFALNENWQQGQFSSLRAGLTRLNDPRAAVLVALVDHPFVCVETYRSLIDAFMNSPDRIVIPVCEDKRAQRLLRGHPVVIPADVLVEIAVAPDDLTLRDIIRKHSDLVLETPVEDQGVLKDIDTVADLEELEHPEV